MTILAGWREQYDRMLRSHSRLVDIASGQVMAASDDARDALFHFFQDAYHLKDWIKNDPTAHTADIEKWVNRTAALRLCADLCNNTKHLKLRKSRTGDPSTSFDSQSDAVRPSPVGSGLPPAPHLHRWTVRSKGRNRDARKLADKVVVAWKLWLRRQRLL